MSADAKRTNQQAHERIAREKTARMNAARMRSRLEREAQATVTYLDTPAMIGGLRVLGVTSDASPETKAMYGIQP